MLKRLILLVFVVIGLSGQLSSYAAKVKQTKKQSVKTTAQYKKKTSVQSKKKGKKSISKKGKKRRGKRSAFVPLKNPEPRKLIADNKEKMRLSDSLRTSTILVNNTESEEGYFASLFTNQKKSASFQTLEGTAAVFKSVSGWEDKKFYILTNQLPVGTIVRITTSDLKSICAKVINALPEVGNSIQYRLSDAAAAILGITNKTFQISVTY
ncbi:MAG: hypothetical protein LW603_07035 [Sediminibacterium sp.]|jgi:hypothetical protein|nr:hypothetical protein [Sediminibacterium sp.]